MATRKKAAAAVEEVEELEDDLEVEELDEDVEEEKPATKTRQKRADAPAFGIQELCALLEEETGKAYTPREVRTQLRKMARDGSGRIEREVTPDNRSRYSWTGADDPEVQEIIKAVTGGEIEANKKAALDALKEKKAKEKAAEAKDKPATKKAASKKKAAPAPDPDEDEELEDDDED